MIFGNVTPRQRSPCYPMHCVRYTAVALTSPLQQGYDITDKKKKKKKVESQKQDPSQPTALKPFFVHGLWYFIDRQRCLINVKKIFISFFYVQTGKNRNSNYELLQWYSRASVFIRTDRRFSTRKNCPLWSEERVKNTQDSINQLRFSIFLSLLALLIYSKKLAKVSISVRLYTAIAVDGSQLLLHKCGHRLLIIFPKNASISYHENRLKTNE